jgi:hypothetical protein
METTMKSCKFSHPTTEHDPELSYELHPIPETGPSQSNILQENSSAPTIIVAPPTPTKTTNPPKPKPRNNICHVPEYSCIRKPIPTNPGYVSERSSCILQPIPEVSPVQDLWKEIKNPTTSNYELRELQNLMKQREAMILREMQTLRKSMVMQRLIEVEDLRKVEDSWSNKDDGTWICAESRNLITASAKSTKSTKSTKATSFTASEEPVKSAGIQEPVVLREPTFQWKRPRLNQIYAVLLGSIYLLWFAGLFMTIAWNLIYRTKGYWAAI